MRTTPVIATVAALTLAACSSQSVPFGVAQEAVSYKVNGLEFNDPSGTLRTFSDNKKISFKQKKIADNAFFKPFGVNGRACIHCHMPGESWTISPAVVAYRFSHPLDTTNADCLVDPVASCPLVAESQQGLDPIFRLNDGANSPNADVSTTDKRRAAYSMLMTKGLIRVGLPIPATAEFELIAVDDPYRFASAAELSLFRRPLPTTNLRLAEIKHSSSEPPTPVLTGVMWDGRETLPGHDIIFDLLDQANGATLGHAQAIAALPSAASADIVEFETDLHSAQLADTLAGGLGLNSGNGGPEWLAANQPFYVGINDVLTGDSQTHAPFNPDVFTIFKSWEGLTDARGAIARGEALFNRKPINIRGVGGLNDDLGIEVIAGTCSTCHDSPNYGHHSVPLPINIGVSDESRRTPDMPLYTLRNKTTGEIVKTTDPGRALVDGTGKWKNIGKFKGPILRGLAARAPYFHNGMAKDVAAVVDFYDSRFSIGFTAAEKADLAAFLLAL